MSSLIVLFARINGFPGNNVWKSEKPLSLPELKCHENEETLTMTMFWEMAIESKLLNQFQWYWYHSFRRQCFIWWNQNMLYIFFFIFEYKSYESRAFRFCWDTRYSLPNVGSYSPINLRVVYLTVRAAVHKQNANWIIRPLKGKVHNTYSYMHTNKTLH